MWMFICVTFPRPIISKRWTNSYLPGTNVNLHPTIQDGKSVLQNERKKWEMSGKMIQSCGGVTQSSKEPNSHQTQSGCEPQKSGEVTVTKFETAVLQKTFHFMKHSWHLNVVELFIRVESLHRRGNSSQQFLIQFLATLHFYLFRGIRWWKVPVSCVRVKSEMIHFFNCHPGTQSQI